MVHKVQDEIMLTPHIDFVIPNEFDVMEFKVFLFSMLPKVIPDLKQVFLVSILILHALKLEVEFSPTKGEWGRRRKKIFIQYYLCLQVNCISMF